MSPNDADLACPREFPNITIRVCRVSILRYVQATPHDSRLLCTLGDLTLEPQGSCPIPPFGSIGFRV